MGRLIASEFATMDGVFEDPSGMEEFEHGGWALTIDQGEEGRRIKVDEVFDAEALLFGRVTYETQLRTWERAGVEEDPGLAAKAMSLPRYVVSSTLEEPEDPNTTVLRGDAVEQVAMLKESIEGTILLTGSAELMAALFEAQLLDEIRIMIYPVILGEGKPLFLPDTERRPVRLARGDTIGEGIAYFVFVPREPTAQERAMGL
jgi:dihydrofolate reductase